MSPIQEELTMLTYEQALERILKATASPQVTVVKLKALLGLALARPIIARCDLPRFDNSAVDGYALQLQDVPQSTNGTSPHPTWRVVGTAEAGRPFNHPVRKAEAVRILTGAYVPPGADAVVMQEHVMRRNNHLVIQRWPIPGQNVRRRGEDLRKGTRILKAGTLLRPQDIGLLAALGYREAPVYQRPIVAVLVTGNEVRPPGASLKPGQIYESNGAMLSALVQQAGARAVRLGRVRDVFHPLVEKIRKGLTYDILLISGGVSVGEKDFVRRAARRCGIKPIFWQVNIKPGMPLFFGTRGRTLVFGLPGNPVSVFVTFEEFVKPALFQLMGRGWEDPYAEPAVLTEDLRVSRTRRTHFIRVRCSQHNQLVAEPLDGQGSHRLRSLVEADGWIRVISSESPWSAGTQTFVKRESTRW